MMRTYGRRLTRSSASPANTGWNEGFWIANAVSRRKVLRPRQISRRRRRTRLDPLGQSTSGRTIARAYAASTRTLPLSVSVSLFLSGSIIAPQSNLGIQGGSSARAISCASAWECSGCSASGFSSSRGVKENGD